MRTVIFLAAMTIGLTANTQIKLPKIDMDSVDAITMYTCGCFCSSESSLVDGEIDYYMTFDIDNYPDMEIKHMEAVFAKFMEVLKMNGHDVMDPDRVMVSDFATYPILKDIKTKLQIGFCPEERFDYVIKGYVVSLIYSSSEYQLFIYKN